MSEWNGRCQRCGCPSASHIMSMFNTDLLCPGCHTIEREHPAIGEALAAEEVAVRRGNRDFPGIGLPPGFAQWSRVRCGEA